MTNDFENAKVGDGATVNGYSDSHAATIIAIAGKSVTVQYDTAKLLNGANSDEPDALQFDAGGFCGHTSGEQRWETAPNLEGITETFTLRNWNNYKGEAVSRWAMKGQRRDDGPSLSSGRHHHYDFNF